MIFKRIKAKLKKKIAKLLEGRNNFPYVYFYYYFHGNKKGRFLRLFS